MEISERAAATLGVKREVDKVVAAGRSAPPTIAQRRRDLSMRGAKLAEFRGGDKHGLANKA